MGRYSAPKQVRWALLLTVLLLFFGVALFSPLHKHTLGHSNDCSLHNIEHQFVSLAEAAVVVAPLVFLLEASVPPAVATPFAGQPVPTIGRAPPVRS